MMKVCGCQSWFELMNGKAGSPRGNFLCLISTCMYNKYHTTVQRAMFCHTKPAVYVHVCNFLICTIFSVSSMKWMIQPIHHAWKCTLFPQKLHLWQSEWMTPVSSGQRTLTSRAWTKRRKSNTRQQCAWEGCDYTPVRSRLMWNGKNSVKTVTLVVTLIVYYFSTVILL